MKVKNCIKDIRENLQMAIELPKCRKCGCMKETLETMKNELSKIKGNFSGLLNEVQNSIERMESIKYT